MEISTGHSSEEHIHLFAPVVNGTSFHFLNLLGTVMLNKFIYFSVSSWCWRNHFNRCQRQHLCTWHIKSPSRWRQRHKHSGIVPQQVRLSLDSYFLFLTMSKCLTTIYRNYFLNKFMQGSKSNLCMSDSK